MRVKSTNSYDQIKAAGAVNLGTGNNLVISNTWIGPASNSFVLVNNASNTPAIGTFNLTQNRLLSGGTQFQVSYTNTPASNTVVLTQLYNTGASKLNSLAKQNDGTWYLAGNGIPGVTYSLQTCTNLTTGPWTTLTSLTPGILGTLSYLDPVTNAPVRFYRVSWP